MDKLIKNIFFLKLAKILCVLHFLYPVDLLANRPPPTIKEEVISIDSTNNGSSNKDHLFFFDLCSDPLENKKNNNNYIFEVVLYGKESSSENKLPVYINYEYNKKNKEFSYKGTSSENKCGYIQNKYKIYIQNFKKEIKKISVFNLDTNNNSIQQGLNFQTFKPQSSYKITLIVNNNELTPDIWSKTTCFDQNGFAYFSSQDNHNCNDLIRHFNKAPVFNKKQIVEKISQKTIKEGEKFILKLPENAFTDEDGDELHYDVASDLPDFLKYITSNKTFKGDPKYNHAGDYTITVTAADAYSKTSGTFALTVKDVNAPPVYVGESIGDQSANEDELWEWTFPADKFTDEDGDALTYNATFNGRSLSPSFWLKFDQNTQKFSGTPLNKDVGKYTISVTATDNEKEVSVPFKLKVRNTNDAPIVKMPLPEKTYKAGKKFDFHFRDHFSDPDRNDRLTYEVKAPQEPDLPTWIIISKSGRFHGTIPDDLPSKSYTLSVKAHDGSLYSEENIFSFNVENVYSGNHMEAEQSEQDDIVTTTPEMIGNIPLLIFEQDKSKTYTIQKEIFSDNNSTFIYKLDTQNDTRDLTWLNIEPVGDQIKIKGQPNNSHFAGSYVVRLVVSSQATSLTTTIQILVRRNNPPEINRPLEDKVLTIGKDFDFNFNETFKDDEQLYYDANMFYEAQNSWGNLPEWLEFINNEIRFRGTPIETGTFRIKVTAITQSRRSKSDIFTIKVMPFEEQTIPPVLPNDCSHNKKVIFSPKDHNNNDTTPQIAILISTEEKVHKTSIVCPESSETSETCKTCFFCVPPNFRTYSSYLWKNSGEYIGVLAQKKSQLENQNILFVKKTNKCKYINEKDPQLKKFDQHIEDIYNDISQNNNQANGNIGQIIKTDNFDKFYRAWINQQNELIYSCNCGKSCNLILLDDNLSYFQRLNDYWTYKTIDYSIGPVLIPIQITEKLQPIHSVKIYSQQEERTNNEYDTAKLGENRFEAPYNNNNYDEFKYSRFFGMVPLNKQFKIPNGFDVQSLYITSIDLNTTIVYSPVFCENNICKYYSPLSVRYTFVWRKRHNGYGFISSLPSQPDLRYSEINVSSEIKDNNIIQAFYSTMQENQIANICISQENQQICFSDFLPQNMNSNTASPSKKIGDLSFQNNARGDYIIFNDLFYFQKSRNGWSYIRLDNQQTINTNMFPFQSDEKIRKELVVSPCFWRDNSYTYYETPIYKSTDKHYQIGNSSTFSIGYDNFMQEQIHCADTFFPKWIIVDEFESDEHNLMSPILSSFKKNELKQLINRLSTYRLDGIKGKSIQRIRTKDPNFAFRKTADLVHALTSIASHDRSEQHIEWELHVFAPRKTSISSLTVSEMDLNEIREKLQELNVKRFCIWEFSNSKPGEETAYKKLIDLLRNDSFITRYKVIYDNQQIAEIERIISRNTNRNPY